MVPFREALHSGRILLMDGAMGTELQRAGIAAGACPESWNLDHPDRVHAIHKAYVDAGAQCLLTNTFQANEMALTRHGLADKLEAIVQAALDLARAAAGPDRLVIGDIGPVGPLEPTAVRRLIEALRSADALLLETWSDVKAAESFLKIVKAQSSGGLPVLLSFTYGRSASTSDFHTFKGYPPESCALAAKECGADALGVNCGRDLGMEDMAAILRRYRSVTDLPLFARPNAGTPARVAECWTYPHTAEDMAARLPELLDAGATMIGGCCGTTPATIAAFRRVVEKGTSG